MDLFLFPVGHEHDHHGGEETTTANVIDNFTLSYHSL